MAVSTDDTELQEWRELVQTPGWARFLAAVEDAYGPEATLRMLESKLGALPIGQQDAVDDLTQHIISAARAARGVLTIPKERIAQLTGQKSPAKPFALWRRA